MRYRRRLLLPALLLLAAVTAGAGADMCPYDLDAASRMMPPSCQPNATIPSTGCCWYVFAAYIYAATLHANRTGAAFLPSPVASACSSSFSSLLLRRALVRPSLLSDGTCSLTGASSVPLAAGPGPCQYPTVSAVRSAVRLDRPTRFCTSPSLDLSANQTECSACQNAVITAVFALLDATRSKEFVPCGMAATIAVWSASPPPLDRFRSYALCMVQVLENVGGLSTANLIPSGPPPSSPIPRSRPIPDPYAAAVKSSSRTVKIAAGSAATAVASLAAIVFLALAIRKRRRRRIDHDDDGDAAIAKSALPTEGLYIFTKAELKQATSGYDEQLLLGEGGAGKVYLGKLPSGQHVAIKRVQREQKRAEFYREVEVLAKLRHRNLATLVGYCLQEHVLVYEYMAGGNLARALHGGGMPWRRRVAVAVDVAEGLAYLHEFPEGAVVHRDVKPTNVLLAAAAGVGPAKLSDFGVSRIVPPEATHVSTELKGTVGYVDPDTFYVGQVSEAADVYSFGVVLLELVTGMRAVVPTPSGGAESIVQATRAAAAAVAPEGEVDAVVDPRLGPGWDRASVRAVFDVACWCVRPGKEERPGMAEVLAALKGVMADLEARTGGAAAGDEASASSAVEASEGSSSVACTSASTPSDLACSL